MDLDGSEYDSELSETALPHTEEDTPPKSANEVVEDLTGEADAFLNDEASLSSLSLVDGPPVIKPRAYQTEMVRESLRRNVIVAMDTGSGKTHVAVMRMVHELEGLPSHQMIWFLAPTVSLCVQQYEYIKAQIPSVQVKMLRGDDGVDRWTEQSLWDAILKNVKIMVSTYQVLLDALTHGFVRMESLGLIVFDEAHNCVGKHAGSKIMHGFYHVRKANGLAIPHILGLTASPVMRSAPKSVIKIEETLDAICRTPTRHRAELLLQVKRPVLSEALFTSLPDEVNLNQYTKTIASLGRAYAGLQLKEDPYVIALMKEDTGKSRRKLQKVILNEKTWCSSQLKSFHTTSLKLCRELGAWAADFYISEVVTNYLKVMGEVENYLGGAWDVSRAERKYLAKALQQVDINRTSSELPQAIPMVSGKVRKLIDILVQEPRTFRGIIFVQERAVVYVLAHLLTVHPETRNIFKVGKMVGTSNYSARPSNISEFIGADSQVDMLTDFRSGKLNLVVATSVLEEGIDIPACNVVICFQKPANLKSFIQRRGRARSSDSKLVLLLESNDTKSTPWHELEMEMKTLYEDDMRQLEEYKVLESTEEHDGCSFRVDKTGALLDLDNAVSHLHHFCATLPAAEYVDLRPEFICTWENERSVCADVILPLCVNEAVRTAKSRRTWASEKNAIKDAAFEAYRALFEAGLVNENMLPLMRHGIDVDELTSSKVETVASLKTVSEQLNPWIQVAQCRNNLGRVVHYQVIVGELVINMFLPVELPPIPQFPLFWSRRTTMMVKTKLYNGVAEGNYQKAPVETPILLEAAFGSRFPIEKKKRHVVLFSTEGTNLLESQMGRQIAADNYNFATKSSSIGLIRDSTQPNVRYVYESSLANKPPIETVKLPYNDYENAPESPHISLTRLARKVDFFHKVHLVDSQAASKKFSVVLPRSRCIVDEISFEYVQFGLLIPSIMHRYEAYLLAEALSKSILKELQFTDVALELVVTAITASNANQDVNYQRFEFYGDSVLKLCSSIQLIAEYPLWHEGYLSAKKDRLVANSRLARAAMELGLDKFIITSKFKGLKWRPLYDEDLLEATQDGKREMSSKVLADVVEALIGTAMIHGGFPKALACLKVFLPEIKWKPLEDRRKELFDRAPKVDLPDTLQPLEDLIGYSFSKKALLLEAITHASFTSSSSQSLERFEWVGDSILDFIVVQAMFAHKPELSHYEMHLIRTALVNADFLAFLCLEWGIEQETYSLRQTGSKSSDSGSEIFEEVSSTIELHIYSFMRHMSPTLGLEQVATSKRFAELQPDIKNAIDSKSHYPWALLAKLQTSKSYSDIVESIFAAIWIDSGSLEECTKFAEKMGILTYLRRILKERVHVLHPKEELGMLADSLEVKYTLRRLDDHDLKQYVCEVFVGSERIVEYEGGVGKMEAQTKAAEIAVAILRKRQDGVYVSAGDRMELDGDGGIGL